MRRGIVFEKPVEPEVDNIFKLALIREIHASRLSESLRRELRRWNHVMHYGIVLEQLFWFSYLNQFKLSAHWGRKGGFL